MRVGGDADIVVWNPNVRYTVRAADQYLPVGFTIFEGMTFTGQLAYTISQGKVIVEGGKFVGQPGAGRFIARQLA